MPLANRMRMAAGAGGAAQYAITFNGSNTEIDCGSDASLDNLHDAAMTVEGWFKFADLLGYQRLVSKQGGSAIGWTFYLIDPGRGVNVNIFCDTTTGYGRSSNNSISLDTWHHIAFTWDDATYNNPRIWIDGAEDTATTQTRNGNVKSDAANNLTIGSRYPGYSGAEIFEGDCAWVRISNNIRYSGGFTPDAKDEPPAVDGNTVEQWNLNDGTGANAAAGVSSPTNDGTITAGSWVEL